VESLRWGQGQDDGQKQTAVYQKNLANCRSSFIKSLEDVENSLAADYTEPTKHRILVESVRANQEAVTLARRKDCGLGNLEGPVKEEAEGCGEEEA